MREGNEEITLTEHTIGNSRTDYESDVIDTVPARLSTKTS